ncbi:MAG: hypothetical protein GY703_13765 [Gammaproteobacteria bacterium]|nr:hypothetical protein [Gammaproteobacteria bacterium]
MNLKRTARLFFREGKSNKVYEVDLCDLGSRSGDVRYLVNFRYRRRGRALREGTKTTNPIVLDEANKLFDSVVVSKTNKGYRPREDDNPAVNSPASVAVVGNRPEDLRAQIIIDRLAAAT